MVNRAASMGNGIQSDSKKIESRGQFCYTNSETKTKGINCPLDSGIDISENSSREFDMVHRTAQTFFSRIIPAHTKSLGIQVNNCISKLRQQTF